MNEQERFDFIVKELEAIYEDFDANVNHLILVRKFMKKLFEVTKGAEPLYSLNEIIQAIQV